MMKPVLCLATALAMIAGSQTAGAGVCQNPPAGIAVQCIDPGLTSPHLPTSPRLNFAMYRRDTQRGAPLFLWMNGTETHQRPGPVGAHVKPLRVAVDHGYRAISVPYDNQTAIIAICPKNPDPDCSEKVRRHRIYDGPTSISQRVMALLQYLDRTEPALHWGDYINGKHPRWKMITVSGQSQGAGMAAFIAKEHPVDRVMLFSSPYDYQMRGDGWVIAPWLGKLSKTPLERWFGGYHLREPGAKKLEVAYRLLALPEDHIRRFNLDLPPHIQARTTPEKLKRKFHCQGVGNPAYMQDWLAFLGVKTQEVHGTGQPPDLHQPVDTDDDSG